MNKWLLLALSSILAACIARGPEFTAEQPPEPLKEVLLYVYRPDTGVGGMNFDVPFLYLDNHRLTRIKIHGYLAARITPGKHVLATTESLMGSDTGKIRGQTTFEAGAGSTVYMRYTEGFKSFTPIVLPHMTVIDSTGDYRFEPVDEKGALAELSEARQLELDEKN